MIDQEEHKNVLNGDILYKAKLDAETFLNNLLPIILTKLNNDKDKKVELPLSTQNIANKNLKPESKKPPKKVPNPKGSIISIKNNKKELDTSVIENKQNPSPFKHIKVKKLNPNSVDFNNNVSNNMTTSFNQTAKINRIKNTNYCKLNSANNSFDLLDDVCTMKYGIKSITKISKKIDQVHMLIQQKTKERAKQVENQKELKSKQIESIKTYNYNKVELLKDYNQTNKKLIESVIKSRPQSLNKITNNQYIKVKRNIRPNTTNKFIGYTEVTSQRVKEYRLKSVGSVDSNKKSKKNDTEYGANCANSVITESVITANNFIKKPKKPEPQIKNKEIKEKIIPKHKYASTINTKINSTIPSKKQSNLNSKLDSKIQSRNDSKNKKENITGLDMKKITKKLEKIIEKNEVKEKVKKEIKPKNFNKASIKEVIIEKENTINLETDFNEKNKSPKHSNLEIARKNEILLVEADLTIDILKLNNKIEKVRSEKEIILNENLKNEEIGETIQFDTDKNLLVVKEHLNDFYNKRNSLIKCLNFFKLDEIISLSNKFVLKEFFLLSCNNFKLELENRKNSSIV